MLVIPDAIGNRLNGNNILGSLVFAPEEQHVYSLGPLDKLRSVRSDMPSVLVHCTPTERQFVSQPKSYKHAAPPEQSR